MFRCFNLLFCLVYHSGGKGDNTTLPCQFEASDIFRIDLWKQKSIFSCQNQTCESGRFLKKEGTCDVIIKNLSFSDAGKYTLKVFYNHTQTVLNQKKERMYQLHIHGSISVQKGEELDDLSHAYLVRYQSSGSTEWKEVWNKVQSDVNHHKFKANDTGTYRVLDSEGNILITVTVTVLTESGTESKVKLDKKNEITDDTKQFPVWAWILIGVLAVLAVIFIVIKITQCLNRDDGVGQRRINAHAPGNGPERGAVEIPLLPQPNFNRGVPP
ncbi:uncharacterized protein LOC131525801 [Onychostoma macrolepis]|uniref:uncharacterized protein LOC131525801 n=1 Tax=Onychostoma macrolepis TaxID=369639 RepID=UPI00272ABF64|nr:uncharacterized protein LOC131525801 [Onychostoma macrolepis]